MKKRRAKRKTLKLSFDIDFPSGVLSAINEIAKDDKNKKKLVRLCTYVINRFVFTGTPFDEFCDISKIHFRKNIDRFYKKDLQLLEDHGILISTGYYSYTTGEGKGQCLSFRFNEDLIYSSVAITQLQEKYQQSAKEQGEIERKTVRLLHKLTLSISKEEKKEWIAHQVNFSTVKARMKFNHSIPSGEYKLGKKIPIRFPKKRLLEIAEEQGKDLIYYKNHCYIANAEKFIWRKVFDIKMAHHVFFNEFQKLKYIPSIRCTRNDTNKRLDHILTNCPSNCIDIIRLDGQRLINLDLKNSQFTFLANIIVCTYYSIMDGTEIDVPFLDNKYKQALRNALAPLIIDNALPTDIVEFVSKTRQGLFYETFVEKAYLDRYYKNFSEKPEFEQIERSSEEYKAIRKDAKLSMMLTCFSGHKNQSSQKVILKKHFPSLVAFIDNFKIEMIHHYEDNDISLDGDKELPIMLQSVESGLFVDNILGDLLEQLRVFSKHDSILCKESDVRHASDLLEGYFDNYFGQKNYVLDLPILEEKQPVELGMKQRG